MRLRNGVSRSGYGGRRGMRVPSMVSTSRPSASATMRVVTDEQQEERHADDQDREADRQRQAGDREREVDDARDQREQHVEQRQVGARVCVDTEEPCRAMLERGRGGGVRSAFWIVASLLR